MSKNKKIWLTSFVVILVGLFVVALQYSEISMNQKLKALETNKDKNTFIQLDTDTENLEIGSEFNLTVFVHPELTTAIELPLPVGIDFQAEQLESADYQVSYDSTSRLITIQPKIIEVQLTENDTAIEAESSERDEREPLRIPLTLKVEKVGEFLLEAKTVSQENSLASNQLTFNVTETYEDVELETDGESEEPIADVSSVDVPVVDVDAPLLSRSTKTAVANVGTWAEFVAAIANPSISKINLTKDITRTVTTNANNPGTLTRSLTIQGNNFTINFGSGGGGGGVNGILLGKVPQETQLSLENVQLVKKDTATTPIFNAVTGATGLGTNWVINLSNITTPDTNLAGLIEAVNATVHLRGTNDLSLNERASHLKVRNLVFEENSIFISQSKASTSATAIGITNGTILVKKNAKVTINNDGIVSSLGETPSVVLRSSSAITGSITDFTMEPKSEVLTKANIYGYRTTINNNFTMTGGAKFEAIGSSSAPVAFGENFSATPAGIVSTITISGSGTRLKVFNRNTIKGAQMASGIHIHGDGSVLNIFNGAEVIAHAEISPALSFFSAGTQVNVKNKAKMTLTQGSSETITKDEESTFYLKNRGSLKFNITGDSEVNITKFSGWYAAVELYGNDNVINVTTGGQFNVRNYGNGKPIDGGSWNANQGLFFYTSKGADGAILNVKDAGSSVDIRADYGPALVTTGSSNITVGEGSTFKLRGNTYSQVGGIFTMSASTIIKVDRPLFFDLRNDRRGGGAVFKTSYVSGSTFTSTQSDLSVWKLGDNLDGNPSKNWSLFDYKLSGPNFNKIDSTNVPTEFNTGANSFGSKGAPGYSRMTGGKARAVVDELRAPTNADKSIYGHVTIPVGSKNGRDALTDEAYVVVKLTKENGGSQELTGSTIGKNNTDPGLSVYGEASRGGMFKIPVPNNVFLETGDKIEVVRAWRGGADPNSNRVHLSLPEDLIAPNRTTFDIIPPKPASITNSRVIDNATKQISGTSDEPGSDVEISVNGTNLATTAKVQANGKFTFNLPHYLEKGDVVQVKLRDHAGLASGADVDHPPSTNNAVGNSNPSKNLTFHDTIFVAVPSVTVADSLPDTNKAVKSVAVDNNKNVTQMGSILTYTIDVANNKAAAISTSWSEVTIEDQLDAGLDLDLNSFSLNGKAIPAANVQFNAKTRLLKVAVGNLATREKAKLTFKARVNKTSIGRTILNKATVSGNSPREVEPFEVGPEKPTAEKQKITTVSNEIANPGGNVLGVLKLVSTPTDISFGEDLKISTKNERYPVAKMSGGLTVQDSRAVKSSWSMTARMVAVLESGEGKKLPNALYYTYKGTDQILGTESILVYRHTSTNENPLTISDSWNTKEGLSLRLQVGKAYTGRYRGIIEWTLQDTPEN